MGLFQVLNNETDIPMHTCICSLSYLVADDTETAGRMSMAHRMNVLAAGHLPNLNPWVTKARKKQASSQGEVHGQKLCLTGLSFSLGREKPGRLVSSLLSWRRTTMFSNESEDSAPWQVWIWIPAAALPSCVNKLPPLSLSLDFIIYAIGTIILEGCSENLMRQKA